MAVVIWVDPLRDHGWALGESCHLMADTREELMAFAARLGLRAVWFQDHPVHPHFDLTAKRRAVAVQLGAVELSSRDSVLRYRALSSVAP